ncbi:T9SS type A sorting domain-containing protein [Niastella caeni]|uniref:T9SS type A sorting domain-containing protein n=1 Tax=Niastella caeni TaxID=2569763 RepID=UPI001AA07F16|nr:T9SS type A sorting domain-containing protein [Niastella caeni]
MKSKFVPWAISTAMCLTGLSANSQCAVVGWASENGGVTGGGTATPVIVTNYTDLKAAITSTSVKVVHVSGTITIPSGGRISFQDQSDKTIFGLPGAKLVSTDLTTSNSGIIYVKRCTNVVFRNLTLEGPGAYDTDGWDNMTLDNCANVWVDHCEFQDGLDGNFDIKNMSDYISVTWCKFIYNKAPIPDGPGGSDDHRFSDLFGSGDGATTDRGHLRVTLQNCWWAQGCVARMPRVRFGKVHVANNLFNSTVAAQCVMAGFEADLLVESNVFENVKKPIDKMDNTYTAITARDNVFTNTTGNTTGSGTAFTPPYTLTITPVANVKAAVMAGAGATLTEDCLGVLDITGTRDGSTRLGDEPAANRISIYPNPAKGKAIIAVTLKKNEQAVIRVYDANGRLVDNLPVVTAFTAGTQKVPYSLAGKAPGIYNVFVTTGKGVQSTYKLVVQ